MNPATTPIRIFLVEAQREYEAGQFAEAKRGQICAFLIAIIAFSLAAYLSMNGHEWTGSFVGVSGVGSIVATFIAGRQQEAREARREQDDQKRPADNKASRRKK